MTNGDVIRNMSDVQIADIVMTGVCPYSWTANKPCLKKTILCTACRLDWLRKEAPDKEPTE